MIKLTEASLLYVGSYLTKRLRDFLHNKHISAFLHLIFHWIHFHHFVERRSTLGFSNMCE